jgi:preprotein translocase subunit SecA
VEENNFGIRKRLLEYDNVMNQQREVVYARRRKALSDERIREDILELMEEQVQKIVAKHYDDGDIAGFAEEMRTQLLVDIQIPPERWQELGADGVRAQAATAAREFYKRKEEKLGPDMMATIEKMVTLQVIDDRWKDHLREMDDLKEGIHLRAYGQKDPLIEYKTEGFRMFMELAMRGPQRPPRAEQMRTTKETSIGMGFQGSKDPVPGGAQSAEQARAAQAGKPQPIQVGEKVGRNDPCPCGSGKKYKQCHGR